MRNEAAINSEAGVSYVYLHSSVQYIAVVIAAALFLELHASASHE